MNECGNVSVTFVRWCFFEKQKIREGAGIVVDCNNLARWEKGRKDRVGEKVGEGKQLVMGTSKEEEKGNAIVAGKMEFRGVVALCCARA